MHTVYNYFFCFENFTIKVVLLKLTLGFRFNRELIHASIDYDWVNFSVCEWAALLAHTSWLGLPICMCEISLTFVWLV